MIETLRPNAPGSVAYLTIDGDVPATTNWDSVDEIVADEDTTRVRSGPRWGLDLYNLEDSGIDTGIINSVTVYARCKPKYTFGDPSLNIKIKTHGNIYEGSREDLTAHADYWNYSKEWMQNPYTGLAWTRNEINDLQAGIYLGSGYDAYCTQVYVEVDYTPPLPQYSLTIETIGQGTTSPALGVWEYPDGALVRVSAIPAAGWLFDHWEGDISSIENPVEFTITSDMRIVAVFSEVVVPPEQYAVSISIVGNGTTNPPHGTYLVDRGTILTITAFPAERWLFNHWKGDISGTINPVNIEVLEDISIVATFAEEAVVPKPSPLPWIIGGILGIGLLAVVIKKKGRR